MHINLLPSSLVNWFLFDGSSGKMDDSLMPHTYLFIRLLQMTVDPQSAADVAGFQLKSTYDDIFQDLYAIFK